MVKVTIYYKNVVIGVLATVDSISGHYKEIPRYHTEVLLS